jgi:hypothetical protein
MAYLTEAKLKNVVDLPIALPDTLLKQGDWLVVATVKLYAPQRLSMRAMTLQLLDCTVDTSSIGTVNRIVPNLGLVYVVLRKDYTSGIPGLSGALDYLFLEDIGVVSRTAVPSVMTDPGNYSVLVANNMQASDASDVPTSTSIDLKALVTGQFRLEL